jgi:hypothetical protein
MKKTTRVQVSTFGKGMIAGGLGIAAVASGLGASGTEPPGVFVGTAFKLVDNEGKVRGSWDLDKGEAALEMTDTKGRTRVGIVVKDEPIIKLWGEKGQNSVLISQDEKTGSWILMFDQDGNERIHLQAAKGITKGNILDANGHSRINAICDPDGVVVLNVEDGNEKSVWGTGSNPAQKDEKKK